LKDLFKNGFPLELGATQFGKEQEIAQLKNNNQSPEQL
jgi:hypothetical protein